MASRAPIEVLEQVCQYSAARDLKRLRQVSRSFDKAARSELFREIHTYCDLESLRKVNLIARAPNLRHLVVELHVHGLTLDVKDFHSWKQAAHKQLVSSYTNRDDVQRFWDFLSSVDLEWHYSQFRYQVESEGRVWVGDRIQTWLADACRSLPRLEAITYGAEETMSAEPPTEIFQYETLDERVQRTLLKPGTFRNHSASTTLFVSLLNALSQNPRSLRTVSWSGLSDTTFQYLGTALDPLSMKLATIRHLKLSLFQESPRSTDPGKSHDALAGFLSSAVMLRTLHLSFKPEIRVFRYIPLDRLLTHRIHWPSLSDLRLEGFTSQGNDLDTFLQAHAQTLCRLEIANHRFTDPPTKYAQSHSWWAFIQEVSAALKLQHIAFEGELQGRVDAWTVNGCYASTSPNLGQFGLSLRDRIHQYVLHGGEFPLQPYESFIRVDDSWLRARCDP